EVHGTRVGELGVRGRGVFPLEAHRDPPAVVRGGDAYLGNGAVRLLGPLHPDVLRRLRLQGDRAERDGDGLRVGPGSRARVAEVAEVAGSSLCAHAHTSTSFSKLHGTPRSVGMGCHSFSVYWMWPYPPANAIHLTIPASISFAPIQSRYWCPSQPLYEMIWPGITPGATLARHVNAAMSFQTRMRSSSPTPPAAGFGLCTGNSSWASSHHGWSMRNWARRA